MAFEHKPNTATVFFNGKKSGDNQPDFTGKGKVGNSMMEFAMWRKKTQKGDEYFYMSFKEPSEKFGNKKSNNDPF